METLTREELSRVKRWAEEEIAQGTEPPWALKRYQELVDLMDRTIAAREAAMSREDSLRLQDHQGLDDRLPDGIRHINSARRYRAVTRARLPM